MTNFATSPHKLALRVFDLTCCVIVVATSLETSQKDSCLLQQSRSSRSLSQSLLELQQFNDLVSKHARQAPADSPKKAPTSGGKSPPAHKRPPVSPKMSPKKEAASRPSVVSTKVEDIIDERSMSQRVELHFSTAMSAIDEKFGSLAIFSKSIRGALLSGLGNLTMSPKRLHILNIGGKYQPDADDDFVSRVDFEILPGPPDESTPGELVKKICREVHDMRGSLFKGQMKEVSKKVAMVVVQGTKSKVFSEGDWSSDMEPSTGMPSRHAASAMEKLKDESKVGDSSGSSMYPWDWFGWFRSGTQTKSTPWLLATLLVALQVAAEFNVS